MSKGRKQILVIDTGDLALRKASSFAPLASDEDGYSNLFHEIPKEEMADGAVGMKMHTEFVGDNAEMLQVYSVERGLLMVLHTSQKPVFYLADWKDLVKHFKEELEDDSE